MTEQDRAEFEAWFHDQPIHPSNAREHKLLRACWLAARRTQDAKVREMVELIAEMRDDLCVLSHKPEFLDTINRADAILDNKENNNNG